MTQENDRRNRAEQMASIIRQNLKRAITRQGVSQQEVARKAGMNPASFSQMLNGNKRLLFEDMYAVCDVLGLNIADLMDATSLQNEMQQKVEALLKQANQLTDQANNLKQQAVTLQHADALGNQAKGALVGVGSPRFLVSPFNPDAPIEGGISGAAKGALAGFVPSVVPSGSSSPSMPSKHDGIGVPVRSQAHETLGTMTTVIMRTSKDDLPALATKPEFIQNVHSNQYYLEEYCSGSVYHVDVVYINADSILISPSRYLVPPLDFEKQNTGSVMLDEDDADYSELLRLTKQLIRSFKDQTIPNVMHIEFYKNETGDFIFGEMAARRGGGLIKQELTAAYGMDQSKANFLLELGLVDADTNITRLSQYGILLETAGLNWPKEKEIPDWAVLESVGKKKGIAHNSVDSDRKFLISGDNEAEIIQRSNHLIHG